MTLVGRPNQGYMFCMYNCVIPGLVIIVEHGRKIAALEQPWSTMVSIVSFPFTWGKPVIKSIAICENSFMFRVVVIPKSGVFLLWVECYKTECCCLIERERQPEAGPFPPFLSLCACSSPPTLNINQATRAVSRSGNQPEVPLSSLTRYAIVHRATRAVHAHPVLGPLISFFILYCLFHDCACILYLLIIFAIIVSSHVTHSILLMPMHTSHTHTHTLSLSCALAFPFGIVTCLGAPSLNLALHPVWHWCKALKGLLHLT